MSVLHVCAWEKSSKSFIYFKFLLSMLSSSFFSSASMATALEVELSFTCIKGKEKYRHVQMENDEILISKFLLLVCKTSEVSKFDEGKGCKIFRVKLSFRRCKSFKFQRKFYGKKRNFMF